MPKHFSSQLNPHATLPTSADTLLSRPLVKTINPTNITASTDDDPIVPNPNPPLSGVFVKRSPKVAPKGRVNTNAIQNNNTRLIGVKYAASATSPIIPPVSAAPPKNPNPELSDKKSPNAVPSVFEIKIAVQ